MNEKLLNKANMLVDKIPSLIKSFSYRDGPDLYFYKKAIQLNRKYNLQKLFDDNYIELLYATLVSWDMNSRGAKMKYYDDFKKEITNNKKFFIELSGYDLLQIKDGEFLKIKNTLSQIYENLHVMKSGCKLVSNSKIIHFILPKLAMPMDGQNTLKFFYGNTYESINKYLEIIECSYLISKKIDLNGFLDNEWNQSAPKVIDNAIICELNPKYRKEN